MWSGDVLYVQQDRFGRSSFQTHILKWMQIKVKRIHQLWLLLKMKGLTRINTYHIREREWGRNIGKQEKRRERQRNNKKKQQLGDPLTKKKKKKTVTKPVLSKTYDSESGPHSYNDEGSSSSVTQTKGTRNVVCLCKSSSGSRDHFRWNVFERKKLSLVCRCLCI